MQQLELFVNKPYAFKESVCGHGWYMLAPFRWLEDENTLERVERLNNGNVVLLCMHGEDKGASVRILVDIQSIEALTLAEQDELRRKVRMMLRLDEDLSEFYVLAAQHEALWEKVSIGRGRLLRSPTVFEDVVKTICTTNTTWKQTIGMVNRLVYHLGDSFPLNPERRAFPTPAQVAAAPESLFEQEIKMGYRSAYIQQLACELVEGHRDLECLRQNSLPPKDLKKALKSIKGVGDYAAHTLLMLIGYYHELAIDSEMRAFVKKKYFDGNLPTDKEILAIYEPWGKWKYLAHWFDPA
jgi:3-methyladenine DNA glycosylase/8-oxoguanine DNA glycosylase